MKRTVLIVAFLLAAVCVSAQETSDETSQGKLTWAQQWKHAFSKEGVKDWKPEFTYRQYTGFSSHGPMVTGGVRVDEKRTFSLMLDRNNCYIDALPADVLSIRTGIVFRRYIHLGKKKHFALYSDLFAGAGWIYDIRGNNPEDYLGGQVGDAEFFAGWNPGIRIRFWKNIHIFGGFTCSTKCIFGFHAGIGF